MAKQVGPLFITGTIDGVIFYKLNGQYYMRSKGDYRSGKQMRKDPYLKRTMANADQFGVASRIVKYTYYRCLPPEVRKQGLFAQLTGRVKRWLQEGKSKEEAETLLIAYMQTLVEKSRIAAAPEANSTVVKKQAVSSNVTAPIVASAIKTPVLHAPPRVVKQARYLSKWKVKVDGQLQVPKRGKQRWVQQPCEPAKTAFIQVE